ncbi:MAG: phosphonate C-P lyase system protein PhnH [Burkholderiales bacterium]|nr:phosphonate C-P lyase system protein PhnH [Burkholderiales bacterium]
MALDRIVPGFADPVLDSQRAFRAALSAMAQPGTIVAVARPAAPLAGVAPAAQALLLALLDADTRLWLSASLGDGAAAAANLRFHTGCRLVADCAEADFALVASAAELPPLAAFAWGTDLYPERSASVVVQVSALAEGAGWRLAGPGVRGERRLAVPDLDAGFLAQWDENHRAFPRGVDLYLACGERLCALARTTRIEG